MDSDGAVADRSTDAGEPMSVTGPMAIGLVGAGKVGLVLARALQAAGHRLAAVWDPTVGATGRVRSAVGDVPVQGGPVGSLGDLIVIAVPDDAIADVAIELAESSCSWSGRSVAHVSGRYGTAVLGPVAERGARVLAMHPAMAFTGDLPVESARLRGARFAVTGAPDALDLGRRLVADMGGVALEIGEADRSLYHAGMAHGSNHLVTLVVQASAMLRCIGIDSPSEVLAPVLRAALDNALEMGAQGATGPVVRADVGTLAEHVAAIDDRLPELLPTYLALTQAGAEVAFAEGRIDDRQLARVVGVMAAAAPCSR